MEKTTLIAVILAVLLVAGVVFASGEFIDKEDTEKDDADEVLSKAQPICGSGTCKQQCGGNCRIPSCGCGR